MWEGAVSGRSLVCVLEEPRRVDMLGSIVDRPEDRRCNNFFGRVCLASVDTGSARGGSGLLFMDAIMWRPRVKKVEGITSAR